MKERKTFWDRNAGRYDRFMRKDRAAYDEMYALIRPVVKAKAVLELATGTGLIAKHIVNAAAHIEVTDASPEMITEAKRDNRSAKLHFSVQDMFRLPYDGERKLSKQIIDDTAKHITLPEGGVGLDIGCGSGALTIACAKRNPQGKMVGIDRWGKEYASFSLPLCEKNAAAEGVKNASFQRGNAVKLDFPDESFDAVTSNYVYHNIAGKDKQALLLETLRVLKKGGMFAIHDLMSPGRYGDMQAFVQKLRDMGYEI